MHNNMFMFFVVAFPLVVAAEACPFNKWEKYQGVQLLRAKPKGAYIFSTSQTKVDADGAPNAYHPDDVGLHCTKGVGFKGLDCPANAGYPEKIWWRSVIVPNPQNKNEGYIQFDGEYKGYLISQTSLKDKSKSDLDINKYVDSTQVPYLVFPGKFSTVKGTGLMGDFGYAINLDANKIAPFIVADIGPPNAHLGEMSIALANALGGTNPNPRTGSGTPKGKIVYVIFPYSRSAPAWPLTQDEIQSNATSLLSTIGGEKVLRICADVL